MSLSSLDSVSSRTHGNKTSGLDELLRICWAKQECGSCLNERSAPCSWCPVTSTCVPNPALLPLFTPIFNEDICPFWRERWELRSNGLGCHVSTITALSVIIAVMASFVAMGLVYLGARFGWPAGRKIGKRMGKAWRERGERWWMFWRWDCWKWRIVWVDIERESEDERRSLLQ